MEFLEDTDWAYELIDRLVKVVFFLPSLIFFLITLNIICIDPKSLTGCGI